MFPTLVSAGNVFFYRFTELGPKSHPGLFYRNPANIWLASTFQQEKMQSHKTVYFSMKQSKVIDTTLKY